MYLGKTKKPKVYEGVVAVYLQDVLGGSVAPVYLLGAANKP